MSNKVFTYSIITKLKEAPYYTEIMPIPQITMSREMANYMRYNLGYRLNLKDFTDLARHLFPDWNTSAQKFAYAASLNNLLRDMIADASNKSEREWLYGCKKNLYFAVQNIINLEEAKVRPEDIADTDKDIILFKKMWKHLESVDSKISDFRNNLLLLSSPEVFEVEINKIFKFHGQKKIIWHGFQFLTPIQQFVYDCFVNTGYDIYALIQDEERYSYAGEIWNYLYNPANGFPDRLNWIRQADLDTANPLGEIFENGSSSGTSNVELIKYSNTVDFVEDIPRLSAEGFKIFSSDDRTANSILKEYYPENYKSRNLLSYPVGQFIYELHKMWDDNRQCIVLSPDILRKCFASGWLSIHGKSSIRFTDDLEKLLPYFDGCIAIDEWNERLHTFSKAYDNAVDLFENEYNPLKSFGVFSVNDKHLVDVIDIIGKLIKMAKTLFDDNKPVSIKEHLNRLDSLLYMNDGISADLYLKERETIQQIFDAIENDSVKDYQCYPGDLSSGLMLFMEDKSEEEKSDKKLKPLVFNLYHVESSPTTEGSKVHICLSDISRLPGAEKSLSWPLDYKLLSKITKQNSDTYVGNWIDSNKIIDLSNRFYLYSALKNKKVEISWIHQQGEKLLSPSPYVTLLNMLSDVPIKEYEERKIDYARVIEIPSKRKLNREYYIRENADLHSSDDELEYAICPMRHIYSNILGNGSVYRNEFQNHAVIVRLIQSLKKVLGSKYTIEEIGRQVLELFPYIRKSEKRQIIDDALKNLDALENSGYKVVGDIKYTNQRLNILFPDVAVYKEAKSNASELSSPKGRKGVFHERIGLEGARNCLLCPHESYCMKSLFGIDYTGEK